MPTESKVLYRTCCDLCPKRTGWLLWSRHVEVQNRLHRAGWMLGTPTLCLRCWQRKYAKTLAEIEEAFPFNQERYEESKRREAAGIPGVPAKEMFRRLRDRRGG